MAISAGYYVAEGPHILTLLNGPVRLRRSDDSEDIVFSFAQQYEIVDFEGGFRVHTLKYAYTLNALSTGYEIMAYHWHPEEPIKYPHLHLSYGARIGREELLRGHLPTGRIAVEDVIQFLIESFNVAPVREDWSEKLEYNRGQFRKYRSWG